MMHFLMQTALPRLALGKAKQTSTAYPIARQTATPKSWKFHTFTFSGVMGTRVLRKKEAQTTRFIILR